MHANKPLTIAPIRSTVSHAEWQARLDLAACYRLCELHGMSDMIYTHIMLRVPDSPRRSCRRWPATPNWKCRAPRSSINPAPCMRPVPPRHTARWSGRASRAGSLPSIPPGGIEHSFILTRAAYSPAQQDCEAARHRHAGDAPSRYAIPPQGSRADERAIPVG
jgi:hypothetical protein